MVLPNFLLFDILPGVLRPRSDANCLQPSVAEVGRLRLALDGFNADISRMSSREWLESVSGRQGDGIFNLPMKLFPNIRDHERKWNDLKSRASGVINGMIEGDFRVLLTMDGHLRFVYAFLSELLRRGIDADEWTIILMDINSVVDEWHDLFCPANVRHSCGDILATKIEPDTALYLNFCGLGGMAAHVLKCVTEHAPQRPVFLSLSRRGMVPFFGSLWDLTQAIHNMLPPSGPIVIGWQKGAQDFITYRLTPPPIGAQPVDAFREQLPVVAQVPLDFNQASTAEMQNLRQLGPATADKIALERKVRPFRSMLDLRNRIFPSCRNGSQTVDLWERQGARVDAFREQLPVVAQVPLDFNQASTAEMQNLRQLGPATADKIALERKVRPFRSMLDLRNRIFPSCRNGSKTVDLWERQGARVPRRLVAA